MSDIAAMPPAAEWRVAPPPDVVDVQRMSGALSIHPLLARLLINRRLVDAEEARRFLEPSLGDLHDPYALPDMEAAVDRLARAIENKERIFLHGDYDADGVTSA